MLSWFFQTPEEYLNEALQSSKDQNCVEKWPNYARLGLQFNPDGRNEPNFDRKFSEILREKKFSFIIFIFFSLDIF